MKKYIKYIIIIICLIVIDQSAKLIVNHFYSDDIEDHTKIINIIPQRNVYETIINIAKNYLPNIMGYGHSWDCYLNGMKIAIINGNCNKITSIADCPLLTNECELFFKYHSATY